MVIPNGGSQSVRVESEEAEFGAKRVGDSIEARQTPDQHRNGEESGRGKSQDFARKANRTR